MDLLMQFLHKILLPQPTECGVQCNRDILYWCTNQPSVAQLFQQHLDPFFLYNT